MSSNPEEPSAEEQAKIDKEARAKEAAEQAALPYKWTQTIGDVDITVPIDGKFKGRDLDVVLSKTKIKVGVKGQTPIIDVGSLFQPSAPMRSFHNSTKELAILSQPPHSTYQNACLILFHAGSAPENNPHRRISLDTRDGRFGRQGNLHPLGQGKQDGVVAAYWNKRAEHRHEQDPARELQAERPRRRDARYGREDDVRPAPEGDGQAYQRRGEEDGFAEEISGAASRWVLDPFSTDVWEHEAEHIWLRFC